MSMSDRPILIKKIKKVVGGGHHGGAWKVAYADFVTAMMAFFLLMWLINMTDPEQKRGIAEYFAPASVSQTTSGSGGILGGTALGDDGGKGSGSMSVVSQLAPEAPQDAPPKPARTATSLRPAKLNCARKSPGARRLISPVPPPPCARPCSRCRNWPNCRNS